MKEYWVDFDCWEVTADSKNDADRIVQERLAKGEVPTINSIEEKEL